MIIQIICFAQRNSTYNMAQLFEGNKVEYPRGVSVRSVVYFHAHLSCIRSNYFLSFFRIQTLILACYYLESNKVRN